MNRGNFSPVVENRWHHIQPNASAYRAAQKALAGEDPTNGALYFYNPRTASLRGRLWLEENTTIIKVIANHVFAI